MPWHLSSVRKNRGTEDRSTDSEALLLPYHMSKSEHVVVHQPCTANQTLILKPEPGIRKDSDSLNITQ